jgi:methylphosphotriester-DNA--protein-cysteine methyltransferase
MSRTWKLIGADGEAYESLVSGQLGGHRRGKIYGRLDCRAARQSIARGGYVAHRVFFLNEETARAAGYRPCAVCMPVDYSGWRHSRARSRGR